MTRSTHTIAVFTAVSIGMILFSVALLLWNLHKRELNHAHLETMNLAQMLVVRTEKNFESIDLMLQGVQERIQSPFGNQLELNDLAIHLLLNARAASVRHVDELFIIQENGQIINSSKEYEQVQNRLSLNQDFDHFFTKNKNKDLYFSQPILIEVNNYKNSDLNNNKSNSTNNNINNDFNDRPENQATNNDTIPIDKNIKNNSKGSNGSNENLKKQWFLYVAKRLYATNGELRGAIVASMNITDLDHFYGATQMNWARPMSVYFSNGALMSAFPNRFDSIGKETPELSFELVQKWLKNDLQKIKNIQYVDSQTQSIIQFNVQSDFKFNQLMNQSNRHLDQHNNDQQNADFQKNLQKENNLNSQSNLPSLFAFGFVEPFSLWVGVLNDEEKALASWREMAMPIGAGTFIVCLLIAAVAGLLIWRIQHEESLTLALNEANKRYEHTVNSVMDAIVVIDHQQNITFFNPAAQNMFGISALSALGSPLSFLIKEPLHFIQNQIQIKDIKDNKINHKMNKELYNKNKDDQNQKEQNLQKNNIKNNIKKNIEKHIEKNSQKDNQTQFFENKSENKNIENNLKDQNQFSENKSQNNNIKDHLKDQNQFAENKSQNKKIKDHLKDQNQFAENKSRHVLGRRADGSEFPIESSVSYTTFNGQQQLTAVLRDVTKQCQAEAELIEMNQQLRELSSALQSVREEERCRIAQELHDELGQQLTGLKLDLSWLHHRMLEGREILPARMEEMRRLLDESITSVRRISTELRPPILDELGFGDAVTWHASEFAKRSKLHLTLNLQAAHCVQNNDLATALFRIVQESLTNVVRHAQALSVRIDLELQENKLILRITDNGKGIQTQQTNQTHPKGIGMLSMRERAAALNGQFQVISSKDQGTTIEVSIPIHETLSTAFVVPQKNANPSGGRFQ